MFKVQGVFGKLTTLARTSIAAALLLAGLSVAAPAQATLIGLASNLPTTPDITAFFVSGYSLNKTGGLLDTDPLASLSFGTPALLPLALNSATVISLDGAYSIFYNVAGKQNTFTLSSEGNQWLTGDIVKVGEQITENTDTYDFLVKLTSVDPVLAGYGFGSYAGITLGFSGDNYPLSDIFNVPVPEPGTFMLLAAGLIGVAALRRRIS